MQTQRWKDLVLVQRQREHETSPHPHYPNAMQLVSEETNSVQLRTITGSEI